MLDNSIGRSLFALAESSHLRQEAMNLFEQCLTGGSEAPLITFIELQLVHEPPRLDLLHDITNDLQQRLLSLREYHFDVRDRVVRTFSESYDVDITPLTPPSQLERYHLLTTGAILDFVREKGIVLDEKDFLLLQKMVDASLRMAAQLHNDIQITTRLHQMAVDWMEGVSITVARQYWTIHTPAQDKTERNIYH